MTDRETLTKRQFTTLVRVRPRLSTPEVREALAARFLDPSFLEGDDAVEPFVWEAIASNNIRDFYHTRMAESTLENFAKDAKRGVSFLDSHAWGRLGIGYTFDGLLTKGGDSLEEFPNEMRIQVAISAYTIPGYNVGGGISSDNFIRGVRASLIRDVSVGFYATMYRCSVCGENMWSWDCWHIPGFTYEIRGEDGKLISEQTCFAWVEEGRLSEVSAVYDGANEDAGISSIIPFAKAQVEAEAGRMKPLQRDLMESRYRARLPVASRSLPAATAPKGEERTMPEDELEAATIPVEETPADPPAPDPVETTELDESVEVPDEEEDAGEEETPADEAPVVDAAGERAKTLVASLRSKLSVKGLGLPKGKLSLEGAVDHLIGEVKRLRSLADDGNTYRQDLISEVMAEGRRAQGSAFREETYKELLADASLARIKEVRQSFVDDGDKRFNGGRKLGTHNAPPAPQAETNTDNRAFA